MGLFDGNTSKNRQESTGGTRIDIGLHTNLKVEEPVLDMENKFIEFIYSDLEGKVTKDRVYFPERDRYDTEEIFEDISIKRVNRIVQHTDAICGSVDDLTAENFVGFAAKSKQLIMSSLDSRVNILLNLNKELKYAEFPMYGKYIERYEEGKEPTIAHSEWTMANRMTRKSEAAPASNSSIVEPGASDKLPF